MNAELKLKFLGYFNAKHSNQGFTIIELLVMSLFIGALAAIAWTTLLAQVGKARNSELSITVGTINRAQQQYHLQHQQFTNNLVTLGVTVSQSYQSQPPDLVPDATALVSATVKTYGTAANNGTRGFSGMIAYNPATASYSQIICSSTAPADDIPVPVSTAACPNTTIELQ